MYGSNVDKEGNVLGADNTSVMPLTGERVRNVKLIDFDFAKDKDDAIKENQANFVFQQENGSQVKVTLFEGSEEWQIDQVNRNVKHVCTKIVTEEEYNKFIEENPVESFQDFVQKIKQIIGNKAEGKLFTMKFVYNKKGYVGVPTFPNFITTPDNEDILTTNPKYDKYVLEKPVDNDTPEEDEDELF